MEDARKRLTSRGFQREAPLLDSHAPRALEVGGDVPGNTGTGRAAIRYPNQRPGSMTSSVTGRGGAGWFWVGSAWVLGGIRVVSGGSGWDLGGSGPVAAVQAGCRTAQPLQRKDPGARLTPTPRGEPPARGFTLRRHRHHRRRRHRRRRPRRSRCRWLPPLRGSLLTRRCC